MPRYDDESMEILQIDNEYKFSVSSIKELKLKQYTSNQCKNNNINKGE